MRILFLSQLLPLPLDAGPKIRSYYVLRYLAEAGHEVTLVCLVRPSDRKEDVDALGRICRSVHTIPIVRSRWKNIRDGIRSLSAREPFLILRDRIPEMHRALAELTAGRSFDAVHSDQLWMAPYGLKHAGPGLKVLDQHNAVFTIPTQLAANQRNPLLRVFLQREAAKLAAFERSACRRFDRVVWVTDGDKKAVFPQDDPGPVIPIAVDPSCCSPLPRPDPFRITFLGGMHWPPNAEGILWFVRYIWPEVSRAAPGAVLTLIGKGAPRSLLKKDANSKVEIAGFVPDLQPYLSETAAFIVPLRSGAGMRVKILDAWNWGLPVVSTSVGADGIRAVHDDNILIADDAESFSSGILRILQDRKLSRRLSENGRSTVESLYDWRKVYPAWDGVYR